MSFGIARTPMLNLLADAMEIRSELRSAFLGRFQHLQRLKLIEGVNPGRGVAAEYKAHQMLIIAVTMQMLQLGLSPERAVDVIRNNQDRVHSAISIAVRDGGIHPALLWFDAALISQKTDFGLDLAVATFDVGYFALFERRMKYSFETGYVSRVSIVSVSNSLWQIVMAIEQFPRVGGTTPKIGEQSRQFIDALIDWTNTSDPESLL